MKIRAAMLFVQTVHLVTTRLACLVMLEYTKKHRQENGKLVVIWEFWL